jgi:hypothetical protein
MQLAALPAELLQSLLGSGTLQAASEVEVAQVSTFCFASRRQDLESSRSMSGGRLQLRGVWRVQVAVSWLEAHPAELANQAVRLLSTVRLPPGQLRSEVRHVMGILELWLCDPTSLLVNVHGRASADRERRDTVQ